jgi:hypothetical protein
VREEGNLAGRAFISYVREDSDEADQLQRTLEAAGIGVWRDTADLWPGEDWRARIRHAITDNALVFIACFSSRSLARQKSYQNEELVLAIEQLRLRRPDVPWLIPVRLDECSVPDHDIGGGRTLASIQRVDLFGDRSDEAASRLVASVLRILGQHSGRASGAGRTRPSAMAGQPLRIAPRPVYLVGREQLLADLYARLGDEGNEAGPRIVALCGMGGAGKTSVAVEYAHRHLAETGLVWQFPAEDATALAAGFDELARQLGARDLLDAGDPVAWVHGILASRPGRWLLIFDNAPDAVALQSVLPPAGDGQVLVTTQDPLWPGHRAIEIPVLDAAVAAEFLITRTGDDAPDAAQELAGELGGLPLALEQAAAYMQAAGRSIAAYLDLFRIRRDDLLARGKPAGYSGQVATTWSLAFGQLRQRGWAAATARLLRL